MNPLDKALAEVHQTAKNAWIEPDIQAQIERSVKQAMGEDCRFLEIVEHPQSLVHRLLPEARCFLVAYEHPREAGGTCMHVDAVYCYQQRAVFIPVEQLRAISVAAFIRLLVGDENE